jgi:hemin uptake protein HemP
MSQTLTTSNNTMGSSEKASVFIARGTSSIGMDSSEILRGQKVVEIKHNGLTYRLQATRLGKLILTK